MGIPSYFSHIIRNYSNIIRNVNSFRLKQFQHLFMDCNSIIYDAVHLIEQKELDDSLYEDLIIKNTISIIENYIKIIKPKKTIYIAFDGVAPFAKMQQQRIRRNKTCFSQNNTSLWNTSAITPGTPFMKKLSQQIYYHFKHMENKYNVLNINISCSDEPGEGEHKLFDYLRNNDLLTDTIALYGLDADLIMLSIFHLQYCKNIFVFREAPEFLKNMFSIDDKNSKLPYFLDMNLLTESLLKEMNCKHYHKRRIYDYVFLCFFLGNDFLPHFPSMNIRTHGIQVLLDVYRNFVASHHNAFIINENNIIQWKYLHTIIKEISKMEHDFLLQEYSNRKKFDNKKFKCSTPEEKDNYLLNVPIIYRNVETYISPNDSNWEDRYYKSLFNMNYNRDNIQKICINYIEGLEWVFKYYTTGCPHWKWKYNYHYPPLFSDLYKYIPHFETHFIHEKMNNSKNPMQPFSPYVQLSYVLPCSKLELLPNSIYKFLNSNYKNLYPENCHFIWAFCRYFWEAHPILPEISLELLEQWDIQFKMYFNTQKLIS